MTAATALVVPGGTDEGLSALKQVAEYLAIASSVEETLHVRSFAQAAGAYARAKHAKAAQADALGLQLSAERKAGEFLAVMPKNPGTRPDPERPGIGAGGSMASPPATPKLSDLGVTKGESSRFQKLARIPHERFAEYVRSVVTRTQHAPVTVANRLSVDPHPLPVDDNGGSQPHQFSEAGVRLWRAAAPPNHWTFAIPPVRSLLARYVGDGRGWADPFAGRSALAEWTNDLDALMPSRYHVDASEFALKIVPSGLKGVLYDPPYSKRQISEHYKAAGRTANGLDTSEQFHSRVRRPLGEKVREGGIAISFGWNSTGFGHVAGFELIEVGLVNHSQGHNDTIVTVERKRK